jgi:hypothetical protein
VIDAAAVDERRRLILIRRDSTEHLMLIGRPSDVVIEANIVPLATPREEQAARPPAASDTLPAVAPRHSEQCCEPRPLMRPQQPSAPPTSSPADRRPPVDDPLSRLAEHWRARRSAVRTQADRTRRGAKCGPCRLHGTTPARRTLQPYAVSAAERRWPGAVTSAERSNTAGDRPDD